MAQERLAAGRRRAAQAVAARRGELGMDRSELAAAAEVDPKTLYNLEVKGRWPIAVTRARVEKALGWPAGEMERIASAEPEDPGLPTPAELEDLRAHAVEVLGDDARPVLELLDAVVTGAPLPRRRGRGAGAGRWSGRPGRAALS